ncbi:Uncharacterised protein [Salmonella enterica subsp. salamae]|uniref:Uncharacterized protein n=1 Tax=Salmonella enterica subsp. salamae TaxID=59202 RepID=A0A6D2GD02_SALER|nr:Uncharacterised protein [Salmonella enterica subsp. salamae]
MLKRLAYLIAGSALLLLAAAMFWCVNRLNTLTLAQQQTQHQIVEWRGQSQQNDDYHQLQATVKNTTNRTEALARQLADATSAQAERLHPINEELKELAGQIQTLSASYQHLQQQTATRSRAKAKHPVPSPLWAAKASFFSYQQRVSRRAAVRRHRAIRLSLALTASTCGSRRQRAGLATAATGRQSCHFP